MNVELSKKDLSALVKGTSPNYDIMENDIVKKCGSYTGGFCDEWNWNYGFEKTMTEEELYQLYILCRDSWS